MQKGKFGFSLWLYPYVSLWALFLEMNLIPFLIAGFVIAIEQDEWSIKQCLHTIMICVYFSAYRFVMGLFIDIPVVGTLFIFIDMIVDIVFFIMVFVMGFGKLKKGESISMFGMGLINQAYSYVGQPQYAPAPQQPQPQQQAPQQMQQQIPQQQVQQVQQQYAEPIQQAYSAPPQPVYTPQAQPQVQPQVQPQPQVVAPPPAYIPPAPPSGFAPPPPPPPPPTV